ncbi:MAG: CDP-diacylglycerol--glycerol-3-phosphate 3-phosphatidyltransferase [Sulfobacillus acidophilus]|uniref:CDP-diacylglycerol--glycerol-3-phosphate 3-phosphatidyltransferase n=1 Tax=Sulfobacillus acidophilus TaxID=53633 RepID=A0A2T2WNI0_9FIRM|nr:MAG: CDP-diacylglycerol--glycerol-3-phosphate 3-phosphatidyltransferase [Sulfobacillus acidophilus]
MVKVADYFTFSRLLLTPVVVLLWLSPMAAVRWAGVGVFVVAGLTDVADGRIARHFKQSSRFGSYVDPFADKLLVLGPAVALVYDHRLSVWWFVVVLARELAVTTLRSVLKADTAMPASRTAKWKTLTQLFAIGAASVLTGVLPLGLVALSGLLTIWSGAEYIVRFWHAIDL